MPMMIKKYDIVIVDLKPTKGSEQQGVRPCLVVQNDEANARSRTTVVCSFSSAIKLYPHKMKVFPSELNGLSVESCLDLLQIRTIDVMRIHNKIGVLDPCYQTELRERFMIAFDLDDLLS